MFRSLKTKIVFFIFVVLAVTASAIFYFTLRDVGQAMLQKEEASAQNVLRFVQLNIQGGYDKLLAEKLTTIVRRKTQLKNQAKIAASILKEFGLLAENRLIGEKEAQKRASNTFRSIPFGKGNYWFVFDKNARILVHSDCDLDLEGCSIEDLRDMKGQLIAKGVRDKALKSGGEFSVFRWKNPTQKVEAKQLGYFTSFPRWQWTVGTVIGMEDLEAEVDKKLKKIIEVLENTFAKIQIAKSGFIFLFNGKKEMIISPVGRQAGDHHTALNSLTQNRLLDDLMATAKSQDNSTRYVTSYDESQTMQAYVSYFKPLDWYVAVNVPVSEIHDPAKNLVTRLSYVIALIFLGSLIAAFLLVTRISRPLNMLASYAKELPFHDFTAEEEKGSPIDNLPAKFKDEVGRLAQSLLFMKAELKKSIKDLMTTTAAKERIESELSVARDIQMGILPKTFPAFPQYNEFDLYAMVEPAKQVGGDLYDFFLVDEDHLCFAVGDVSDKGVPAALFMVITKTLINTMAQQDPSPAEMMVKINNILSTDNPNSMFVTLVIGILNFRTGKVRYSNGGHNPPILIKDQGGVFYEKQLSGPVVGAIEDVAYKELSLTLNPGDALFLYSDGITEAMNPAKELFSDERLLSEIELLRDRTVEDVIARVNTMVKEHAGSEPQSDDIAMLMIRYAGNKESPT